MKRYNKWFNTMFRFPWFADCYMTCASWKDFHPIAANSDSYGFSVPSRAYMLAQEPKDCPRGFWRDVFVDRINPQARAADLLEIWNTGNFLRSGVKLYVPSAEEFTALSQVEIRVPWSEFQMPFESFGLVIPDSLFTVTDTERDFGEPVVTIARLCPVHQVFSLITYGNGSIGNRAVGITAYPEDTPGTALMMQTPTVLHDNREIESFLSGLNQCTDLGPVTHTESEINNMAARVLFNVCLLMTEPGALKKFGPVNPSYYNKLKDSLDKKGLPEAARAANTRSLRLHPVVYGFQQHIKLLEYKTETQSNEATGETWHVKPHWRRGHWLNQACGKRGQERHHKRQFRPAVLVNRHLLEGPDSSTRVIVTR